MKRIELSIVMLSTLPLGWGGVRVGRQGRGVVRGIHVPLVVNSARENFPKSSIPIIIIISLLLENLLFT